MYFWKIQYDKDLPNSVTTLKEAEPLYTFRAFDDQSIAGEYNVSLIALTQNLAPSGNYITCSDTTETTIVLVNDFLQFPNVVTPNGDGINDIFEIKNLVDGLGYPTNELSIFNRWGKRVYHKENISSEDDFWDPAADNSPSGTYFFRFVGKGYLGNIQRNGVIEVLR
jgi:gliding motility-associated-like protein